MTEAKPAVKKRTKKPEVSEIQAPDPLPDLGKVEKTVAVVDAGQVAVPIDFRHKLTQDQIELIKEQFAKGASDDELKIFLYVCMRTGLDPFSRQIHMVPHYDGKLQKNVMGVVVGIDGFRSTAERTGKYAGGDDATFEGETTCTWNEKEYGNDGRVKKTTPMTMTVPAAASVVVRKLLENGQIGTFSARVEWSEYYPGEKKGHMWRKMPKVMLGKCAEAKVLRKAFPSVMSGIYVPEEMHQAAAPVEVKELPPKKTDFQIADEMISQTTNADGLERMKEKVNGSTKYTEGEKETLMLLMDDRIAEIRKEPAS